MVLTQNLRRHKVSNGTKIVAISEKLFTFLKGGNYG
jgi:hypothetical protein